MLCKKKTNKPLAVLMATIALCISAASPAQAADYPFPVIGPSSFTNDYDAPRGSEKHNAIDIIADKHQMIISRSDGVVTYIPNPEPSWGWMVRVKADNGNEYNYVHLNNDAPGTDDGKGGPFYAYGPDIQRGNRVVKGQLLGYVGDSGNAENTVPHLHFEVLKSNGKHTNPYKGLRNNSYEISRPNQNYPLVGDEIIPSSVNFRGGYNLAAADIDDDDVDELIVAPGPGGKRVKIIEQDGSLIRHFEPNGATFLGGVDIAVGDVNGDNEPEIITGTGEGGKLVKIFDTNGTLLNRFQPNNDGFRGGVGVAVGDVNGDGVDEIIVGSGPGGKYVKVFTYEGKQLSKFAPFSKKKGTDVAVGNFDDDPELEIVAGAGPGAGAKISVHDMDGSGLSSFYPYNKAFQGGVRVAAADVSSVNPHDEIISLSQEGGLPHARIGSVGGSRVGWTDYFAEEWWRGHYNLAATSNGEVYASMGVNRRSTIRPVELGLTQPEYR